MYNQRIFARPRVESHSYCCDSAFISPAGTPACGPSWGAPAGVARGTVTASTGQTRSQAPHARHRSGNCIHGRSFHRSRQSDGQIATQSPVPTQRVRSKIGNNRPTMRARPRMARFNVRDSTPLQAITPSLRPRSYEPEAQANFDGVFLGAVLCTVIANGWLSGVRVDVE